MSNNIHYLLKSKVELYDVFNKSKLREKEFLNKGTNKLITETVRENTKENYKYQEKLLKLYVNKKIKTLKHQKN